MTKIVCALAIVIAVMALDQRPAQANAAPWCAVVNAGMGDMQWDCQYQTIEQCYPHVIAGNRGFCNQNPAYQGEPPRQHAPRHHVRRN